MASTTTITRPWFPTRRHNAARCLAGKSRIGRQKRSVAPCRASVYHRPRTALEASRRRRDGGWPGTLDARQKYRGRPYPERRPSRCGGSIYALAPHHHRTRPALQSVMQSGYVPNIKDTLIFYRRRMCQRLCQPVFLQCRLAVRYPHAFYTTLTLPITYAARLYPTAYA